MQIEFISFLNPTAGNLLPPEPAIKHLPDWYKKKKPTHPPTEKPLRFADATTNVTVKWCNPFGDALGSGYFIFLENDLQVSKVGDEQSFVWGRGGEKFITTHSIEQVSPELIPKNYSKQPWKFQNEWGIKTPKGYSVLFSHPLNRTDLPFITLSGVVETDTYNKPVNFPFIIQSDFEGVIEAGTPIVQIAPFKRENWNAKITDFDLNRTAELNADYDRKMFRPYKLGHWKRKSYK